MNSTQQISRFTAIPPRSYDKFDPGPTVMTEEELIRFLRILEISSARSRRNVVENLKRKRGLPWIHLCGKAVYLTDAVKAWFEDHITCRQ